MQVIQSELKLKRALGRAGGDLVQVEVNGLGQVLTVKIDPSLLSGGDQELLEDLLPAAINDALAKSKELHLQAVESVSGGLDLSGMRDMLGKFDEPTNS